MAFFVSASKEHIKKERAKARDLKKSQWWKQKLAQGHCYYCEETFPKEELTMDHVVPLARGGKTTKSNCVVSCKKCNHSKKYKTPAEEILERLNKK